jgi:hypothetical protein
MTDSVRVVDLGNGNFETRNASLTARENPWVFAAKRHIDWLQAALAR